MIRLHVLGSVDLLSSEGRALLPVLAQPKRTALLCYLAIARPRGFHRRDVIKAMFWPEHDAEHARHALRQALYFLRRATGAGTIVSRGEELAVAPEQLACDAWDFERALSEERPEEAFTILRGELLPGLHVSDAPEFERWPDSERARLHQSAAAAAWMAADWCQAAGDPARAAEWARRATGFAPGDETGLRRLLLYLERLGDRAAALRAYEAFVEELAREYELEPSTETRLLAARIRDAGPATAAVTLPSPEPDADGELTRAHGANDRVGQLGTPGDAAPARAPEPATMPPGRRPWTAHGKSALIVALFLAALGAWWGLLHDAGKPERVIVADFSSAARDSTVADLVGHLLRSELARAPMLSVVGQPTIDGALRRMRVQPGVRLSPALARDVAIRDAVRIVVGGRVDAVGFGVGLSASVIEAARGDIVFGATDTVPDRRDARSVLEAVSRLAAAIRRGTGESVAGSSPGDTLWSFTTRSTLALARHMAATHAFFRGDYLNAADLVEDAVAIDPEFAHAYLLLAGMQQRAWLPLGSRLRALERAYALRGSLTPRERYAVEGNCHLYLTGDVPQAIEAFRRHVEARVPGEGVWYQSYARALIAAGELSRAREILDESRTVYSTADSRALHVSVLVALGEAGEAAKLLTEWMHEEPRHPALRRLSARLLAMRGAWAEAHDEAERIRRETGLDNDLFTMALIDAVTGRLDEARSHLLALRKQALTLGAGPAALEISCLIGQLRLLAGDATPIGDVEDVLRRHPISSMDSLSRPYVSLALFYARAGRIRQARVWLESWERDDPQRLRAPDQWLHHRVLAALDLAENDPEEAVRELRAAAHVAPLRVGLFNDAFVSAADLPDLARAYDSMGRSDSATAVYERYLAASSPNRIVLDAYELAPALERLAQLYEARGDGQRAAATLARLADQWREADAGLRPRVLQAAHHADALRHPGS